MCVNEDEMKSRLGVLGNPIENCLVYKISNAGVR